MARIVARVIVVHSGVVARVAIAIVKLNTSGKIGSRYIAAGIVAIVAVVHSWIEPGGTSPCSPSSAHVVARTAGTQPAEPAARAVAGAGRELHGRHRRLDRGEGSGRAGAGARDHLQVTRGLKWGLGVAV